MLALPVGPVRIARNEGVAARSHQTGMKQAADDALLERVLQAFDDGPPGFGRGLPANLLVPAGQPARKKLILPEREVIHRQPQGFAHGGAAPLRELHHYVDLQNLSLVVK